MGSVLSKEKNQLENKSFFPITKSEFETQMLCVDFIGKIRDSVTQNDEMKDIRFAPRLKGYVITLNHRVNTMKISILCKDRFFRKLKIKVFINGKLEKTFKSKTKEDNSEILNEILKLNVFTAKE